MLQHWALGGPFSSCSPSAKITECLTIRAGHCLSEPLTVLDKVSLWLFLRCHWEEPHSYTITQGCDGVLALLHAEIFSLQQSCFHCTVSGASASLALLSLPLVLAAAVQIHSHLGSALPKVRFAVLNDFHSTSPLSLQRSWEEFSFFSIWLKIRTVSYLAESSTLLYSWIEFNNYISIKTGINHPLKIS